MPRPLRSPIPAPVLETERLVIAPAQSRDADELEALFHDPRVHRYLPYERRIESGHTFVERARRGVREGSAYRFVGRGRDSGEFVVSIGVFAIDRWDRSGELGYAVARSHWRRGYATEATTAVVDWSFRRLGLHRIEAVVQRGNRPSERVLERLGFRPEGRLRDAVVSARGFNDLSVYGLLADEWPSSARRRGVNLSGVARRTG